MAFQYEQSPHDLLRNYSYKVEITFHDPQTGELTKEFVTISSNNQLSEDYILLDAETLALRGDYGAGRELVDSSVVSALQSKSLGA